MGNNKSLSGIDINELVEIALLIAPTLGNDAVKVSAWLYTDNANLGYLAPTLLLRVGRFRRLKQCVQDLLSENIR